MLLTHLAVRQVEMNRTAAATGTIPNMPSDITVNDMTFGEHGGQLAGMLTFDTANDASGVQ